MNIITKVIQSITQHWPLKSAPALKNFRKYTINDHNIFAMARPSSKDLPLLQKQEIDHVIALNGKKLKTELAKNYQHISWDHFETEDFTVPTPAQFNDFNLLLDQCLEKHKCVAVHCGAGNGRTGTYLAGYWLQKQMQLSNQVETGRKSYTQRLSIFDVRHLSGMLKTVYLLLLKLLYGFKNIGSDTNPQIWDITVQAVKFVKSNAPQAVETPEQLAGLQKYAEYLAKQHTSPFTTALE